MADKDNENNELLKEVLAELKTINERNKKVDEEERKKIGEISEKEISFLFFGVVIALLAQVFYDFYGSSFPKPLVGLAIAFFLLVFIILYIRNQKKKNKT
jgi:F0F1-type ATP synthase assembly protein I